VSTILLDMRRTHIPVLAGELIDLLFEKEGPDRSRGTRAFGAGRFPIGPRFGHPLERSASEPEGLNLLGLTFDQVGEYPYVVDMVYRSGITPLLAAAREHGARTLDGLEILLAQGALSFELWTGRQAPLEVMRRAVGDLGGSD